MNNLVIVANIKKLCQEHNISISQLEKDLYMSPGLISRWNKNMPTLDRIIDIAEYFAVPLDTIAGKVDTTSQLNKTINRLIYTLYQKSINAEISWEIFNPKYPIDNLDKNTLSVFLSNKQQNTFFCSYNNGYFFLTITYDSWETTDYKLQLYILANPNAMPELRCSDTDKLHNLYLYLNRRFEKTLNAMLTDNYIDDFLKGFSLPEPIPVAKNTISIIKPDITVVNQ